MPEHGPFFAGAYSKIVTQVVCANSGIRRHAKTWLHSSRCVCRTSRVCSRSQPTICARMEGASSSKPDPLLLSSLLFGRPLSMRDHVEDALDTELARALDDALAHAIVVLQQELSNVGEPLTQATHEWARVLKLPATFGGISARRACLLLALHREPTTRVRYARRAPELVADLTERVLPITTPPFIAGMAQSPDAYVVLTTMLLELFPGEPLGAAAHVYEAGAVHGDGGDRERACASA